MKYSSLIGTNWKSGLKIQVPSTEFSFYYDSVNKQLVAQVSKKVIEPASIHQEIEMYSKVLESLTETIEKLLEETQSAIEIVGAGISQKIRDNSNFEERKWLKYISLITENNLNPCLEIRKDIEGKIVELDVELKKATLKQEAEQKVRKHLKELIPLLDKVIIDDYKFGVKDNNEGFYFTEPNVRAVFSTKVKKGKKIISYGKFLDSADGVLLAKSPVIHGKTIVQEADNFDPLITEFLVYKRFAKGSDILLAIISEIIDSYEEKWGIDLEESIKQDRLVSKKSNYFKTVNTAK